jgi:MFS family permease
MLPSQKHSERMVTAQQKRALIAACLGWMLDAMDVMLYSLVLSSVAKELGLKPSTSGLLVAMTLVFAAIGGLIFGRLADHWGRARAMTVCILTYSIFTGASGLAQNVWQLAVCRILLGLGMGGEWATGATLVAETWPAEHRGKAMGLLQSFWAVGYALAVGVNWYVAPRFGWRAVFFVGVLPAVVVLWIQRKVEEPEIWREQHVKNKPAPILSLFQGSLLRRTLVATGMNAATLFAWWGLFTWLPSYLALPVDKGGRGLPLGPSSSWMLLMQLGAFFGYVTFGYLADKFGDRRTYLFYLVVSGALAFAFGQTTDPFISTVLSPFLGFFCTGCFSGFAIIAAALFPTAVRGTALGFTYNLGRIASAVAPYTIGKLSETQGLSVAFWLTSGAYMLAAIIALGAPDTTGKALE